MAKMGNAAATGGEGTNGQQARYRKPKARSESEGLLLSLALRALALMRCKLNLTFVVSTSSLALRALALMRRLYPL
jgi:hypothetical protein